jgi:NSS family neurotransmitter:Na+ symporter
LSLFAGLLLFPIVLQASNIPLTDPGLLFAALPKFLLSLQGGPIFGFAFFICLYLAALGASIGLLEVIVSNAVDRLKVSRSTATWTSGAVALLIALVPAMSSKMNANGKSLLEDIDGLLINFLLPLIALAVAWTVRKGMTYQEQEKTFVNADKIESRVLFSHWLFVMKWVVPGVIAFAFLLRLLAFIQD